MTESFSPRVSSVYARSSSVPNASTRTSEVPSGILEHEIWLQGSGTHARTGVLLIHGLTGTPKEMRVLARGLNDCGFTVYAVKLAGHCGSVDDLLATRWRDWVDSTCRAVDLLSTRVEKVIVGGLSMGAVLALSLAQRRPGQIDGVMALSTTFYHDGWSMPWYSRLSALVLPCMRKLHLGKHLMFNEQPPYGIMDEALRARIVESMNSGDSSEAGLPGNPWWSGAEMLKLSRHTRKNLDKVQVPCLVIHARNDDIASMRNALEIVNRVKKAPVTLMLLTNSYHMITIDRDRRQVISSAVAFATSVSSATTMQRSIHGR